MKTIRCNVFETNSSSCHSVAFPKNWAELDDFRNGKLMLLFDDDWDDEINELFKYYKEGEVMDWDDDYDSTNKAMLVPVETAYNLLITRLKKQLEDTSSSWGQARLKDLFAIDEEPKIEDVTIERFVKFHRNIYTVIVQDWRDFLKSGDWNCPISIKFTYDGNPYLNCAYHD